MNVKVIYQEMNLPMPVKDQYENQFEKEAFMTVNLLRTDPTIFVPMLTEFKHKRVFQKIQWLELVKKFQKMKDSLPLLKIDTQASFACK